MRKIYLMMCGHVSNSRILQNQGYVPYCVICGCSDVIKEVIDNHGLNGRKSKCRYCKNESESSWRLPYFEYKPIDEKDAHYCGCFGWD